jgi:hypothetical protein
MFERNRNWCCKNVDIDLYFCNQVTIFVQTLKLKLPDIYFSSFFCKQIPKLDFLLLDLFDIDRF